jgi:hypothetical protein
MRATIVAQYPLPGGGKVALSILADSMTGEQYELLAKVISTVVPLAESLGWTREGQPPVKTERAKRTRSEPAPTPPRLSAVPHPEPRGIPILDTLDEERS